MTTTSLALNWLVKGIGAQKTQVSQHVPMTGATETLVHLTITNLNITSPAVNDFILTLEGANDLTKPFVLIATLLNPAPTIGEHAKDQSAKGWTWVRVRFDGAALVDTTEWVLFDCTINTS